MNVFLDTNVLFFAVSKAPAETAKGKVALDLLDQADAVLRRRVAVARMP